MSKVWNEDADAFLNPSILSDRNALLLADRADLIAALTAVLDLIDSGYLVRDVSRDHESDWAMRQIVPVGKLASARNLLARMQS